MSAPELDPGAARIYDQVSQAQEGGRVSGDVADARNGWALAHLVAAVMRPVEWLLASLAETDDDPPLGRWLHPDRTPAGFVRWLGQFHGVRVTKGAPEAVQRDEVKTAAGRKRGRRSSMIADVLRTLTGDRYLVVFHVSGNRWKVAVHTRPGETPDPATTLRAIRNQKPYGMVLEHIVSDSPIWDGVPEGVSWDDVDAGVDWDSVIIEDVEA